MKRTVARRKVKRSLQKTGKVLKSAGKAAAVAGVSAAAVVTAREIVRGRRS